MLEQAYASYSNQSFDLAHEHLSALVSTFEIDARVPPTNDATNRSSTTNENRREVSLAWRDLHYEVHPYAGGLFGKRKSILSGLSGSFESHSLNALMGPSGAGKTTLLNCLSGNAVSGLTQESEIFINCGNSKSRIVSYFIEQHVHETIVGEMRVRDILQYAFTFKNGLPKRKSHKEEHIARIIKELLLPTTILDRLFRECSGGEQKRIAIAQELMSLKGPEFLFVDEPTTGLDSSSALEVVKCLKALTDRHRITVVASIHAPSNEILKQFDKLYVLARGGGGSIYSGPPQGIEQYLELRLPCGLNGFNINQHPPIEVLMKIACNGK